MCEGGCGGLENVLRVNARGAGSGKEQEVRQSEKRTDFTLHHEVLKERGEAAGRDGSEAHA